MSDMTHDEFLKLLGEIELGGDAEDWREGLPAGARSHAEGCADCARAAAALARLATDEEALFDEPPESYWSDFEARLSARLERAGASAAPASRPRWRRVAELAAAASIAVTLAALALRGLDDGSSARRAELPPSPATSEESAEELLAAWANEPEGAWSAEAELAAPALEGELPGALGSPLDRLHDDLLLELDDEQAAELARLLREEIAS